MENKAFTFVIDGEPTYFPGNEAALVNCLFEARQKSASLSVNKEDLELAVWGWVQLKGSPNLAVLLAAIRRRVPGLIETINDWSPLSAQPRGGSTWILSRRKTIERAKRPLRAPRKGHLSKAEKPPTYILSINGKPWNFHGREAKIIRLMMIRKLAFRSVEEIAAYLKMDPENRAPIDRIIIIMRARIPTLFQTGPKGRGWRLTPQTRYGTLYDEEAYTALTGSGNPVKFP